MSLFNAKEIELALKIQISQKFSVNNISIDSRKKIRGSLYIPIIGKNFDGHDFIDDAFANGAKFCLCNKSYLKKKKISDEKLIVVNNTLKSLQKLAIYSRRRAVSTLIIGITGSNGKTTVKNWSYEVLKHFYLTHASYASYNNHIGLPLSLCNMPKNTEICILELGTNRPGEIDFLSKICKPHISIITNIGNAHIGNFRSKQQIALEKGSIYKYLKNGDAIIPGDSQFCTDLKRIAHQNERKIHLFGKKKKCLYRINKKKNTKNNNVIWFEIIDRIIKLKWKVLGEHYQYNALIILTLSNLLNINLDRVKKLLAKLIPTKGRGSVHEIRINGKKIFLLDESYNANPDSMENAINTLKLFSKSKKRKVCIIGEMLELGNNSKAYHIKVCKSLIRAKVDVVYTIGSRAKIIYKELSEKMQKRHFNDIDDLYNFLVVNCADQDRILIKGSNSVNLSLITKKLMKEF